MKYNKTVILKNGQECTIRSADGNDAQEVFDCFNLTHEQTDWLLTYPDERTFTVEDERKLLDEMSESENETELIAVTDGKVVGTAGICAVGTKIKNKHRAEFGISIEKAYWGIGIGKALTQACIECAKTAGYEQVELEAVAENEAALSLYKKAGFVEYGRNPRGFKSRISGYQELVYMRMEL